MDSLSGIRRSFEHARWADQRLLAALRGSAGTPAEAWREYGHIIGADETWLARLERRLASLPVWPAEPPAALETLTETVHAGYAAYLARRTDDSLGDLVAYTNSAGKSFETSVQDILQHVPLHAQYHRGKTNLLLRQAGLEPAPTDYIAFVRGVPAATSS